MTLVRTSRRKTPAVSSPSAIAGQDGVLQHVAEHRAGSPMLDRVDQVDARSGAAASASSISVPVDARPATGSQPSQTEKTSLSSRPAKNTGVA